MTVNNDIKMEIRLSTAMPVIRFNSHQEGNLLLGKMFIDDELVGDIVLVSNRLGSVMPWLHLVSEVESD